MTLSEFQAWFQGFTEQMDGPPTAKQWKRVVKRVGEISETPISYPVFVDRWVRPYWGDAVWGSTTGGQVTNQMLAQAGSAEYQGTLSEAP